MGGRSSTGNRNTLPKYSNEEGVILQSVVEADSRYSRLRTIFNSFEKHVRDFKEGTMKLQGQPQLADDFLRRIMKMEERGETSGSIHINIWNDESLKDKMSVYKQALKELGYKITGQDNNDVKHRGYVGARGQRVYTSTSRARTIHFELERR